MVRRWVSLVAGQRRAPRRVRTEVEDPLDAAAAVEGSTVDRDVRVDTGWLAKVDPWDGWPQPTFVALRHPALDDRSAWYRWLDASIAVIPTGPVTWIPVDDPAMVGPADLEQPLYVGRVAAGNGAAAWLTVEGASPGAVVPPTEDGTYRVQVVVQGAELDHLVLRTDHATLQVQPGTRSRTLDGRWVLLEGWSDDPDGDWVVTGPVWLSAP